MTQWSYPCHEWGHVVTLAVGQPSKEESKTIGVENVILC